MSSKSHSLNLWNIEDDTSKLDIDVTSAKVAITTTGSQFIEITPALKLIDAVGGDIPSVSSALHTLTASVTAGNAGSAAASALVQSNLDAYQTSNDSSLATLNATVVANKAITDANHTSDAASRVALETSLETKISDEETARISADDVLTASFVDVVVVAVAIDYFVDVVTASSVDVRVVTASFVDVVTACDHIVICMA